MSDFWTPARVDQLRAWWTSGRMSSGEIAGEWGVSRNMIMGKIKRLGLLGQGRTHGGDAHGKRVEPTTPDSTRELRGCRWIEGDVLSGDWWYCQAKTPFGSSWCREHHARVFLPGTAFNWRKAKAA